MALNAAADNNTFPVVNLIEAMNYAIDNGAKIINMSLSSVAKATPEDFKKEGFYDDYFDHTKSQLRKVFNKAIRKDILIVMAAGNSGQLSAETQGWKGIGNLDQTSHGIHSFAKKRHLRNIILVGSVDPDRRISNYSSYGKKRVDIAAPGGNKVKPIFETDPITGQVTSTKTADYGILSTMVTSNASEREKSISMITKQGNYISENGTSMAAPMVSGAAALVWGENESLGPDQVKKILMRSAEKIDHLKKSINLNQLNDLINVNNSFANFKEKIQNNISNNKTSIIAEIKKASPSAGIIIDDYNPVEIANIYKNNKATCLSVLTEEDFFLGNIIHISKIKEKINLPILCKDFFIDTFQIPLAKSYGADAILIILAGVSENLANQLYEEALKLNMSVIVEVHTVDEAKKALNFKEALIGINNRNLKTLKTDINTTYDIYNVLINHEGPLISESGIKTKEELLNLKNKTSINTFLIGESLLKNLDKNSIFSVL